MLTASERAHKTFEHPEQDTGVVDQSGDAGTMGASTAQASAEVPARGEP